MRTRLDDDAADLAHLAELAGALKQSELARCYVLFGGHVALRFEVGCASQHRPSPGPERRGHTGCRSTVAHCEVNHALQITSRPRVRDNERSLQMRDQRLTQSPLILH